MSQIFTRRLLRLLPLLLLSFAHTASAVQPSATQVSAVQSPAVQSPAAQPSAAQSSAAQPSAAQPSAAQPSAAQPSAAQPSAAQSSAAVPIDRIVAVVNDDVITATELDRQVDRIRKRLMEHATQMPPEDALRRQVLEKEIMDRIQLQLAKRDGIEIDDPSLDQAIRRIAQRNKLTLSQFRDVIEHDGYNFANFREDIRKQMTIAQLRRRAVFNRITVSEREIKDFIALHGTPGQERMEYHLGHILIALPEAPSAEQIHSAREKADDTVSKLRAGADFANTAIAVSSGQQALKGGDLGWRNAGQLPILFADALRTMKVGDVSDPIRSASGFHIIKLLGTRGNERRVITQTHARHILIRTDAVTTDDDARLRLEQLRTRILAGADFAALARANSQDPGSAADGGDLGWTNPGTMVPRFEEVMNSLSPGEISEPFKTRFGWHIVQVLGRRKRDVTAEYQRSQVIEAIRKRKADEQLDLWLRRLRDEAYVDVRLKS